MAKGDHLCVNGGNGIYSHHAIDLGNGKVIHYTGRPKGKKDATIKIESIQKFANGREIYCKNYEAQYSPDEIVRRAKGRIGEKNYDIVGNNCEQFVYWCRTGQHVSQQVNKAAILVAPAIPYAYIKQKTGAPKAQTPQKADSSKYNPDYYSKKRTIQRRIKSAKMDRKDEKDEAIYIPAYANADSSKYNPDYYSKKRTIQRRIKSAKMDRKDEKDEK